MGMCATILAARYFRGTNPAQHMPKFLTLFQPLKPRIHRGQRLTKRVNGTVAHCQCEKQPARAGMFRHNLWQGLIETGLPHHGTPPLTDRTVPDATEPCITQPQARFSGLCVC
ncbi:hypothetical protein C4A07_03566 [Escherichia coli]|nr:hypothetical protein C4A07_03566 [Escherichia coli]